MNAIGTHLRDPMDSGLTRWRMAVLNKQMDAAAELGRSPVSKHQIHMEMSRLTQDGTAEPVLETKFSGANADREILIFFVQLI